jgi:hypothetical protein
LLRRGLRYAAFRRGLDKFKTRIGSLLATAGLEPGPAGKLAAQVVQSGADPAKVRGLLSQAGLAIDQQVRVIKLTEERLGPFLRAPVQSLHGGRWAQNRFASAYLRSLVLALFVLLWFFIVPVPGLFVFTARQYRISIELSAIVQGLAWGVGLTLAAYWIGLLIEHFRRSGWRGAGLTARIQKAYRDFQAALRERAGLTEQDISAIYALFTDAQTYLDQRSFEYAQNSLAAIERKLAVAGRPIV